MDDKKHEQVMVGFVDGTYDTYPADSFEMRDSGALWLGRDSRIVVQVAPGQWRVARYVDKSQQE
jgi:hypothetical protein